MRTLNKEMQQQITPEMALELLKEGNKRFASNVKLNRNLQQQVNETAEGQWPFAVILSCIDSRASAELIFDQGLGDIFSVRIAGNVVNEDILGSMEFACKIAGAKLIVVLGHTRCGAVKGACDGAQMGNLTTLLSKLEPAVQKEQQTIANRTSSNPQFVENVASINVRSNVQEVLNRSVVLNELVAEGKIGIIGAMYNVSTGEVSFYEDTKIIVQPEESVAAAV